jgi:ClpP class serine protease
MSQPESKPGRDQLYAAAAAFLDLQVRDRKSRALRTWVLLGLGVGYFSLNVTLMLFGDRSGPPAATKHYAAVVRIDGTIATGKLASERLLSESLDRAFADNRARCVALAINSLGGMVAQSQLIHDTIQRLKQRYDRKVIAVGEDYMASGGYMVATAAERIYAPTTGIVGSIGVIQQGIDLSGLAERYGIQDRT